MTSLTIYFCQLNFAVKVSLSFDDQILDNFDITNKSKSSFFHNKAIFETTLPVHVKGHMEGDLWHQNVAN